MIPSALSPGATPLGFVPTTSKLRRRSFRVSAAEAFPSFIPKQVEKIKDPFARKLAARIERLPVQIRFTWGEEFWLFNLRRRKYDLLSSLASLFANSVVNAVMQAFEFPPVSFSEESIMSSCVKPLLQTNTMPVVLLHGFDSSCLEWRYTLPLLEEAGLETWAMDILGWGFSDLERLPSCDVASKRDHLYQFWKSYIKRPMLLVGPSLGAAVAIDFAVNHPEAVEKLVLLDASVYSESTSNMTTLPNAVAYAGVYLLKSIPLRLYATYLAFNGLPFDTCIDWSNVGRLHCLLPWWEDATVAFMNSGGYNVVSQIERVKHRTLIIWGEEDQIISNKLAVRLHCELRNAIVRQVPDCGHIPHVEKPSVVANLIVGFSQDD